MTNDASEPTAFRWPWRTARLYAAAVVLVVVIVGLVARVARASDATVAVAANFLLPLRDLEQAFEAVSTHRIDVVSGSTGQLYAQILNGAPFDVMLAADRARPALLAESDFGDAASVFTYAVGRLALWSSQPGLIDDSTLGRLDRMSFRWLAIANPGLAPYGLAARQALEALGVWAAIEPRIVQGQNIGQTFAMVESGAAELGFVALSQAKDYAGTSSYVMVPAALHEPIRQDAIVLSHGADNTAAREFVDFVRSDAAQAIIERHGYSVPSAE